MSTETPSFDLRTTTERFAIDPPVLVEQQIGNGLRRVLADMADVVTYHHKDVVFCSLSGPTIKRDGTRGRYASVGWHIGGRNDETATAPQVALDLAAEVSR